MVNSAPYSAADGGSDDDLCRILAARSPAQLCELADDLVEGRIDEVRELNFRHGQQAVESHADGSPDDSALREGRVHDAIVAEFVPQSLSDSKDTSDTADILAKDNDAVIPAHLVAEGIVDRLDHVPLGHAS